MSYKRAWMLVEEMNAAFTSPLVESARGGAKGGGAVVTEAGLAVIAAYRAAEAASAQATTRISPRCKACFSILPSRNNACALRDYRYVRQNISQEAPCSPVATP